MAFGRGQDDPSLCPSSISARGHEQRQGRNPSSIPLPEQAVAGANHFWGSSVPGSEHRGRRGQGHACSFSPPLLPGEKFAHLILCERRGTVSQAGSAVVSAGHRNSREVGWRPLSPCTTGTPGGKGWGGHTGGAGTPKPRHLHPALGLWAGPVLGCPGGCRVRHFAFLHLSWPPASLASWGQHRLETGITRHRI